MISKRVLRKNNQKYNGDDGFTFIETLIVMGIILILTATVGFMAVRYLQKAKVVAAKTQIETFSLALQGYYLDCGSYPTEQQGLNVLWQKPQGDAAKYWNGPYLAQAVPKDPWTRDFIYKVPGPNGLPFVIVSYGEDGLEGGEGNNLDVSSAQQ